MDYINLEFTNIINLFNINIVEHIFVRLGGLEKNSFNIADIHFSDNSRIVAFVYPTDFTLTDAYEFIEKIYLQLEKMSLSDLQDMLYS